MTEHAPENALVSGLGFPEEPRWRDGALWFIDNWNKQVIGVREDGAEIGRLDLDFPPGGIGWLPDGELVVVDQQGCRVVAVDPASKRARTYADLSELARLNPNGLCTASDGTLYVTTVGSEVFSSGDRPSGNIIRIAPDAVAEIFWETDLPYPNGAVLAEDERLLYVAETFGQRVSVFDLSAPGSRRTVTVGGTVPDGICDAGEESFWFADVVGAQCVRARIDGEVLETRKFSRPCYAPVLNGDRSRLYVAIADSYTPDVGARGTGALVWTALD
jgi:sugar lactone lactonase YvrE